MRIRILAFVVAAIGSSAPSLADDPPIGPTSAAVQNAYSKQLVCTREHVTGSMIPKKVCRTREQIDKEREATKEYADEIRRNTGWNDRSASQ